MLRATRVESPPGPGPGPGPGAGAGAGAAAARGPHPEAGGGVAPCEAVTSHTGGTVGRVPLGAGRTRPAFTPCGSGRSCGHSDASDSERVASGPAGASLDLVPPSGVADA